MGLPLETAGAIVNQAALEVGLASVADPFASMDPNFVQLCALLKSVGRNLRRRRQWTFLTSVYTFNTVSGTANYALPYDYGRFIDRTFWNRTNQLPMAGPLSPTEFEYLKGRLVGVIYNTLFRALQGQLQVYPDVNTPGNYVIAYEYTSRFWVIPTGTQAYSGFWAPQQTYATGAYLQNGGNIYQCNAGGVSGTYGPIGNSGTIGDGVLNWTWVSVAGSSHPESSDDLCWLDAQLLSRGLKYAWLAGKGLPSQGAKDDFDEVFEQAANDDTVAPVLNISPGGVGQLIGGRNLPFSGWGL